MSQFKNRVSICNLVCILLMLAVVVAQLLIPCWTVEKKEVVEEVSLGKYVWFANDYKALTNEFKATYGKDFKADVVAFPHLFMVLVCGFGLVFCLKDHDKKIPSLFCTAFGFMNCYYYLTNPVLSITSESWLFIVAGAIVLAISLVSIGGDLPKKLLALKAKKAA